MTTLYFAQAAFSASGSALTKSQQPHGRQPLQAPADRFIPRFGEKRGSQVPADDPRVQELLKVHRDHLGEPTAANIESYRKQVAAKDNQHSGARSRGRATPAVGNHRAKR